RPAIVLFAVEQRRVRANRFARGGHALRAALIEGERRAGHKAHGDNARNEFGCLHNLNSFAVLRREKFPNGQDGVSVPALVPIRPDLADLEVIVWRRCLNWRLAATSTCSSGRRSRCCSSNRGVCPRGTPCRPGCPSDRGCDAAPTSSTDSPAQRAVL